VDLCGAERVCGNCFVELCELDEVEGISNAEAIGTELEFNELVQGRFSCRLVHHFSFSLSLLRGVRFQGL